MGGRGDWRPGEIAKGLNHKETTMLVKDLNPILNVSDIQQSFDWFETLGWKKLWDWGDPLLIDLFWRDD